jgi:hypothetical protein
MAKKFGIALNQRSTWVGLIWILTASGISLDNDQHEAIIEAGLALSGLFGIFWKD